MQKENLEDSNLTNEQENSKEGMETELAAEPAIEQDSSIEKLKAEVTEAKDKYLRLYSDFENFRRRTAKERIDFLKTANEDLVVALLPVIDDFERAKNSFDKTGNNEGFIEGIDLVFSKMNKTLENKGLKLMKTKGEAFDIELHEAITQIPAPTKDLKGKVVDEVEKGYFLGDKVIRFAKVVIGS